MGWKSSHKFSCEGTKWQLWHGHTCKTALIAVMRLNYASESEHPVDVISLVLDVDSAGANKSPLESCD